MQPNLVRSWFQTSQGAHLLYWWLYRDASKGDTTGHCLLAGQMKIKLLSPILAQNPIYSTYFYL
jgi:hypothetical protein